MTEPTQKRPRLTEKTPGRLDKDKLRMVFKTLTSF